MKKLNSGHTKEIPLVHDLLVNEFSLPLEDILFFYFLHTKFSQPLVYNWSYKKLQDITGLSANKVKKHIDFLRKHGMIGFSKSHDGNGHMRIHSVRRFCNTLGIESYKTKRVDVYKSLSFRDFKAYILGFLIDHNQVQQRFIISAKSPKSKRELNLSKSFRKSQPEKVEGNAVGVVNSIQGLAKIFNKSEGFVQYWLPYMEAKGIITKKTKLVPFRVPRRYASSVERCADISCAIRAKGMFYKYINGKFFIVAGTDINVKCLYGSGINGKRKNVSGKSNFLCSSSK